MGRYTLVVLALCAAPLAQAQTRIEGTIADLTGEPLPFATVSTGDGAFNAQTDASGHFALRGLRAGEQQFVVASVGFTALDTLITLTEGLNAIMFRLHASTTVLRDVEVSALRAGDRAPFAKSVLTKEEIARMNTGVDLPYLLDRQPNVVSTSDGGTGIGYTYMRIRGTDGTRTNITLNGVPFNDAESQGAFLVDLPDIATSAEDIEIQRGVGTSTNGPAAFGATVNLRTTTVKREAWGQAAVSGGSFNTQRYSVSAGTGLLGDHFSLDMRLSSITSDGYVDRATADLKGYFLQGAWVNRKSSVRFITFRGKELTYQAWGGVPREVIDTNRTFNPYTYKNQVDNYDQAHFQLLFDHQLGRNTALNVTLFRVNGAGYFEQLEPNTFGSAYGLDDTARTDVVTRKWLDNALSGTNMSIDHRFGPHRLVLGGSYSDYEGSHYGDVIWSRTSPISDQEHRYYDDGARKTDANAFGKLTYAVNAKLDVFADAQVRHVEHRFVGLTDLLGEGAQRVSYTFFNPKAGLLWRVAEGAKAHASIAVANREPDRDDLVASTPQSRPKSERLTDLEAGYERRTGRSAYGINLYYMDYADQLVLTGELNDVGAAIRTNVPRSYRAGVELSGAWQATSRILWKANLALSRNKVIAFTEYLDDWDNGGQQVIALGERDLSFSPDVVASSELGYRIWTKREAGHADLTLVTKYVGRQFLDNTSSTDRMLDPYVVNDLRANVSLNVKGTKGIDINLTVRNLFSELYESNGWAYSYFFEGQRQAMVGLYPQAPLNVLGGVTVRF